METSQQAFLNKVDVRDEYDALKNTVKASFARNKIYNDKVSLDDRKKLGVVLKAELQRISEKYDHAASEEDHCRNIEQLADTITKQFRDILKDRKFKIGTAQKALNLFLKFRWCFGKQKTPPPHCPLDSKILKNVSIYEPWTKLDCIETYKTWIKKVEDKAKANRQSLPVWELENWMK